MLEQVQYFARQVMCKKRKRNPHILTHKNRFGFKFIETPFYL